jgi:hypothetical protein
MIFYRQKKKKMKENFRLKKTIPIEKNTKTNYNKATQEK